MEFNFNINHLIGDEISVFDRDVRPHRRNADGYDIGSLQSQLLQVIDRMGEASSRAQGLRNIITTGRKMQISDHVLYIKKDASANNGKGTVVGILKVGFKKLFVYNHHGNVHEMEPMCVLDFYVHESRQRMGCGRQLFDYMLHDQKIQPQHLAIDKPSFKFSQFLAKHYSLRAEIPQVNNFVVFEGFFSNRGGNDTIARRRSAGLGFSRPPSHPGRRKDSGDDRFSKINGYSPSPYNQLPPLAPHATNGSRPSSGRNNLQSAGSALSHNRRDSPLDFPRNGQLRPLPDTTTELKEESFKNSNPRGIVPKQVYSRHSSSASPPSRILADRSKLGVGGVRNNVRNDVGSVSPQSSPADFLQNLNLHQEYQGRRGHMRVESGSSDNRNRNPVPFLTDEDRREKQAWRSPSEPQNWTVYNREPGYLSIAARNYTHTRLW